MANGFQGPPAVDFYSMLSGLGDTLQKNAAARKLQQQQDARTAAFSQLDPNSKDFGQIATQGAVNLLKTGDIEGGTKMLTMAQAQAERDHALAREGVEDKWAEEGRTHDWKHQDDELAIQRQTAARLANPVPAGYQRNPDGSLAFQRGGPEDPMTVQAQAAAKARADAENPSFSTTPIYGQDTDPNSPTYGRTVIMQAGKNGSLVRSQMPTGTDIIGNSPDSIKTRATRYLDTGDDTIINPRNFSGPQGQADYRALQNEIETQRSARGMRPDEISSNKVDYKALQAGASAGARTKAVRETNLDLILRAADAAIPAAMEASDALPRSDFVPLNKLIQRGQVMTSDPRLLKFGMANLQLAEHWARAMNPTGVMRESDRDKALNYLDTAMGNGTYKAGVGQLRTQIQRERDAVHGSGTDYDIARINGGRPIKVASPDEAAMYPPGTKLILPDGSPGVVP